MNRRARVAALVSASLVCFGLAGGYLIHARQAASAQGDPASSPAGSAGDAAPVRFDLAAPTALAGPRVVFRSTAPGATFGQLATSRLAQPNGSRALLGYTCERAYATATGGACLAAKRGLVPSYGLLALDRHLRPGRMSTLVGLPSRVRMSADGRLIATTTFVTGHSYAGGDFSTETIIRRDGRSLGNLETFRTVRTDGSVVTAADRNFWGVTFAADGDTFFATAAAGATTWLVRGSLRSRSLTAVRDNAECPSLSPDGTRIAYKKRLAGSEDATWQLAVLDLASGRETPLPATRGLDDQVEWLDDTHLLYALPRVGEPTATDVWQVPVGGAGPPSVLIEYAASPAVVRP